MNMQPFNESSCKRKHFNRAEGNYSSADPNIARRLKDVSSEHAAEIGVELVNTYK